MKVLLPSDTNHDITIEPRYYTSDELVLEVYNESTRLVDSQVVIYTTVSGVMTVNFDLEVSEGDKFVFKILDNNSVIYRCKAFATAQDPQSYKLTNNKYKYPNV